MCRASRRHVLAGPLIAAAVFLDVVSAHNCSPLGGLAWVLVLSGVLLGCAATAGPQRSGIGAVDAAVPVAVVGSTGTVSNEQALDRIQVRGVVVVQSTDSLVSPETGRVIDYLLRPGDAVSAGDQVATIQPVSEVEEALHARVLALEAALQRRPSSDEVAQLLSERNEATVQLAREQTNQRPDVVSIVSPSDGVVTAAARSIGSLVQAGDEIASVGATEQVEVHASVPDAVVELFVGSSDQTIAVSARNGADQPVSVRLDDDVNRVVSRRDESEITVLRLLFDNAPPFTDGQRVDIEVPVASHPDLLSVPVASLRSFDQSSFVLVIEESGPRRQDVEVVLVGPERVEVRGALELGQSVMLR